MAEATLFRFGEYCLDPGRVRLLRDGREVTVAPKVFDLLQLLVRNGGELMTKERLLDEVWQRRFVSESALKSCINELRAALQDDAKNPRFIATVAKRGYRFIAPVSASGAATGSVVSPVAARDIGSGPSTTGHRGYRIPRPRLQEALAVAWRQALEGCRQAVFLTGAAGAGKTTQVEMFLQALGGTAEILRGRCLERFTEGEALFPLIEALTEYCGTDRGFRLCSLLRRHAPVLLAQLPALLEPTERQELAWEIVGASRDRMLREACELLEAASAAEPVVLVLENLHWADLATLDFLALLAQRRQPAALLVLATYRPHDGDRQSRSVRQVRQDLGMRERAMELDIPPFSQAEVEKYLQHRFPQQAIAAGVVQALWDRTAGHPLFVVKLVDYLAEAEQWPHQGQESTRSEFLPETVRAVIEREIDRLGAADQRLLGIASAIGDEFSAALLGTVAGSGPLEADRHCENLVRRTGILVASGVDHARPATVVGRYRFRHALYREVVYNRSAEADRARIHRRIALALESLVSVAHAPAAAELAIHLEAGMDWDGAIGYLERAAEHAMAHCANREALAYTRRALTLAERLPDDQGQRRGIRLWRRSASVRRSLGDMRGALADLDAMLATARAIGDRSGEVQALIDLSRVLVWLNRRDCLERAAEALACSREVDDPALEAAALGNWGGWNLLLGGWSPEHAVACRRAMDYARKSENTLLLHSRLTLHIHVETMASRYRAAWQTAEQAVTLSGRLGDGYLVMVGHYFGALALLHLGEWGRLRALLREAIATAQRNDGAEAIGWFRFILEWLHAEAMDFPGVRFDCETSAQNSGADVTALNGFNGLMVRGLSHLGAGRADQAIECFLAVAEAHRGGELPIHQNLLLPTYRGLAEASLARHDLAAARRYASLLRQFSVGAPERSYLAMSQWLEAEIALAEKNLDTANVSITTALGTIEEVEVPLAAWRVYRSAAKIFRLLGRLAEAEAYRRRSRAVILELAHSLEPGDPLRQHLEERAVQRDLTLAEGAVSIPSRRDREALLAD